MLRSYCRRKTSVLLQWWCSDLSVHGYCLESLLTGGWAPPPEFLIQEVLVGGLENLHFWHCCWSVGHTLWTTAARQPDFGLFGFEARVTAYSPLVSAPVVLKLSVNKWYAQWLMVYKRSSWDRWASRFSCKWRSKCNGGELGLWGQSRCVPTLVPLPDVPGLLIVTGSLWLRLLIYKMGWVIGPASQSMERFLSTVPSMWKLLLKCSFF